MVPHAQWQEVARKPLTPLKEGYNYCKEEMVGIIWMCTLVSLIAIIGVAYFHHQDTKTDRKE